MLLASYGREKNFSCRLCTCRLVRHPGRTRRPFLANRCYGNNRSNGVAALRDHLRSSLPKCHRQTAKHGLPLGHDEGRYRRIYFCLGCWRRHPAMVEREGTLAVRAGLAFAVFACAVQHAACGRSVTGNAGSRHRPNPSIGWTYPITQNHSKNRRSVYPTSSFTCCSAAGSSIVVRSPGSRRSATACRARRSSLPLRVLGSTVTKYTRDGRATAPSW